VPLRSLLSNLPCEIADSLLTESLQIRESFGSTANDSKRRRKTFKFENWISWRSESRRPSYSPIRVKVINGLVDSLKIEWRRVPEAVIYEASCLESRLISQSRNIELHSSRRTTATTMTILRIEKWLARFSRIKPGSTDWRAAYLRIVWQWSHISRREAPIRLSLLKNRIANGAHKNHNNRGFLLLLLCSLRS